MSKSKGEEDIGKFNSKLLKPLSKIVKKKEKSVQNI